VAFRIGSVSKISPSHILLFRTPLIVIALLTVIQVMLSVFRWRSWC